MRRQIAAVSAVAALVATVAVVSLATPASSGTFPGANGKLVTVAKADQQRNNNIYSVNPDGTGLTRLSTSTVIEQYPSWSADGSKIVFSVDNLGAPGDLGVMNADGSGRTIIYTDPVAYIDVVTFSPDGSKIAFATSGSGPRAIKIINADGTGVITIASGTYGEPQWSPDGQKLAVSVNQTSVALINPDGSGQIVIPNIVAWSRVCFSPDGTRLTYVKNVAGVFQIFAANIDGSGEVQISGDPTVYAFDPCFSPDGTRIAYTQNGALITANADGSGGYVTVMPTTSAAYGASWAAIAVPPAPAPDPSAPKFTG